MFDGDVLADLAAGREEPRQGADRGLHDRRERRDGALPRGEGLPVAPARPALARALGADRGSSRRSCGERSRPSPTRRALEAFLARRRTADPAALPRPLARRSSSCWARASTWSSCPGEPAAGHFGLAVRDYTHSTAPNRRFPDLITQRLLKAALAGAPGRRTRPTELDELARHCTEQEDDANKVERQVRQVGRRAPARAPDRRAVRRASSPARREKGTWVRIFRPPVEGKRGARASRGSTSATGCASSSSRPTSSAGSSTSRGRRRRREAPPPQGAPRLRERGGSSASLELGPEAAAPAFARSRTPHREWPRAPPRRAGIRPR